MDVELSTFWVGVATLALAGAIVIVGLWKWWINKNKIRHPFKLRYALQNGTFIPDDTPNVCDGLSYVSSKAKVFIRDETQNIWLQMAPQKALDIFYIEVRFEPVSGNQPEVVTYTDKNPQTLGIRKPAAQRAKGISLRYDTPLHTSEGKNAKTLDYFIKFRTSGQWNGELKIRIEAVGLPVILYQIPVQVIG